MINNRCRDIGNTIERNQTLYKTLKVDSLDIFYGEAEPRDAPTILLLLLLQSFPASSPKVKNLIMPSNEFHLVAGR